MNCPYQTCSQRKRDDLCMHFAETCKIYYHIKKNREDIAEREARFGEVQVEDMKRVYKDSWEQYPV